MVGVSAFAGDQARQANFGGDNYAPIVFAGSPAPAPSLHQLPAGIHDFSGRAEDVAEIERIAGSSGGGPCIINILGAPGIGKSALAVHVAHRLAERLDQVQLYAELGELDGQVPTSAQILQRLVAALDPATATIPVSAQELPARYRSLLSGRRCLVLLDNAQSAHQIADLVPGTAVSVVLVTSRASLAAVQGILPYHLGLMSSAESLVLLSRVSGRAWPDVHPPDAAHALINQCGRLPLALRIVGATLKKKPHWTLERVAGDLAAEQTRLAKLTEAPLDVRSCFEVSFRQLSEDDAQAFRLLSLLPLALFKPRHAASFLQRPEDYAEQVVETLVDAQLLETDDGRFYRFHDLLRLYGRERSRAAGDDPDGVRATRFLEALTGEFEASYTRCLRENSWTGLRGGFSWPSARRPDASFQAAPDTLYVRTRLVSAGEPDGPAHSWDALLSRHQRVLVLGAGGMGKTILADRICYEIAANHAGGARRYDVGFAVPLRLRSNNEQSLEMLIADAVRARYRLDLPLETLVMLLRDRQAVVIFDGLDELPPHGRDRTARDITDFSSTYPSAKVVMTSRPGPAFAPVKFSPYRIAPFTDADIAAYIERWSEVAKTAPDAHAGLLTAIGSAEIRRDWLATPLLMTQLIAMYDQTGAVPRQEIDLYDVTYSVLFERRDAFRGIRRTYLPPRTTGRLVSYLAYELKAVAGVLGVSDSEFHRLLKAFVDPAAVPADLRNVRDLADSLAALGLPVRRIAGDAADGEPRWSVTRDSFSEYLAARWITEGATFSELTSRLLTVITADDFIAGGLFVAQLTARKGQHGDEDVADFLSSVLDHRHELPENTRAAIIRILADLS